MGAFDELVGGVVADGLVFFLIPFDGGAGADGEGAKQAELGERDGVIELRHEGEMLALLDGERPFALRIAGRGAAVESFFRGAGEKRRRARRWQDHEVFRLVALVVEDAFRADHVEAGLADRRIQPHGRGAGGRATRRY